MSEKAINNGLSVIPEIPGMSDTLARKSLLRRGGRRILIDTVPRYKSMNAFHDVLDEINEHPESETYPYDPFVSFLNIWRTLKVGDTVMTNRFWLESPGFELGRFPKIDTGSIEGQIDGQTFVLRHDAQPTDLMLIKDLPIVGVERHMGHAIDTKTGLERAIRNQFWEMDDAQAELQAIKVLGEHGYPVPQNASLHQFFFPWQDTIMYDWIPGVDLAEALTTAGKREQALEVANLFGQHLAQVWKPLLEGSLPDGSIFTFPDVVLGNYIYTGKQSPKEAFVRIDVGTLLSTGSPIGSDWYLRWIDRDLSDYTFPQASAADLMIAIRNGFSSQE